MPGTERRGLYLIVAMIAAAVQSTTAEAQFSSDFPGVPRASVSITSGEQDRATMTLTGYKIPGSTGTGDTTAAGFRIGLGRSYRIQSAFEAGFDFTLGEGLAVIAPSSSATTAKPQNYYRALSFYAFRIGAKWRPLAALDEDGNGYELSVGGSFQPQLKSLAGYEQQGDSIRYGGQFQDTKANPAFKSNPFASISASTAIAGMASYRARRFRGDAAILAEAVPDRAATLDPSPLTPYTGVSLRAGGVFRLTPSFALGGSYWGNGSPPWSDEVRLGTPGKQSATQWGFLIQLGDPDSGWDIMPSFPTGKASEGVRLYFRKRSSG